MYVCICKYVYIYRLIYMYISLGNTSLGQVQCTESGMFPPNCSGVYFEPDEGVLERSDFRFVFEGWGFAFNPLP